MAIKRSLVTLALGLTVATALLWVLGGLPVRRVYAAALSVTTADDALSGDGYCSLREAIHAANADAAFDACPAGSGADTILLDSGTYTLTIAGTGEDGNATGDLDVTAALTIAGLGPAQTAIDGSGLDRVLDVRPGAATLVISGVTILNGNALDDGGGIYNGDAHLTLINTVVLSNTAIYGGGVYVVTGTVELIDSQVLSNTATQSGGGVFVYGTSATLLVTGSTAIAYNHANGSTLTAGGGGIYLNSGSVTIGGGQVSTNTARYGGGAFVWSGSAALTVSGGEMRGNYAEDGGGIHVDEGRATIGGGQIVHNVASDDGGGVYVDVGQATLSGGLVFSNTALDVGGGLHIERGLATLSGTRVVSNSAPFGGGVFVDQGQIAVNGGEISGNTAAYLGGGLCVYGGSAAIYGGVILGNTAWSGGGLFVYDAPVTMSGGQILGNRASTCGGGVVIALSTSAFTQTGVSTISLNSANRGGGVCALNGSTVLSGGLIFSNTAYASGGGVYNLAGTLALVNTTVSGNRVTAGPGGALHTVGGTTVLTHTTIASNTAASGGGGIHNSRPLLSPLLHNTLLAHNVPANCAGAVDSNGHNLSDDGSCTLSPADLIGLPALIGPLTEDGGTWVHPLLPGSPAIDAGLCAAGIATDQRGQPRPNPVSPFCDIGAYESSDAGSADLVIAKVVTPSEVVPGAPITYVLTFTNAGTGGATDVIVTDVVPASVTVYEVISSGLVITETGPGYTWQVQDLLRGQGGVITLTGALTMGVPASTLTNTAGITATTTDDLPGNNQSQAQVTVKVISHAPPVLSDIPDQTTTVGVPVGPLTFTVSDPDTPVDALSLWADSSDTVLVPISAIAFGGAGTDRTVTVTPTAGLTGTATIMIHVSDGRGLDSDAFLLIVEPYRIYLPVILRTQ
jgi:uncharacterized repeat protein (TIGR01451 family)/CSLREA domain-containing protein